MIARLTVDRQVDVDARGCCMGLDVDAISTLSSDCVGAIDTDDADDVVVVCDAVDTDVDVFFSPALTKVVVWAASVRLMRATFWRLPMTSIVVVEPVL